MNAYAIQPYTGTDVVALVLGITAVLYFALWRRDQERGMGWFSLGMGIATLWVAMNSHHLPVDQFVDPTPWSYVLCAALASIALGLVDYLGLTGRLRVRALWATLLPVAAYGVLFTFISLSGAQILRVWINLLVGLGFAAMGGVAWWAARREPRAGHAYVAVALWGVPLLAVTMAAARVDSAALRYWGVLPLLVLALTLLTVGLLRRRRALEAEVARRGAAEAGLAALNESLEKAIAERTIDLRSMVDGLKSFNRSVSHDLRGPLGGIAGAARLADEALQRGDDALARRVLPLIADQAENSTRLIAALLSLAQVGDMELHRQVVDLRGLVDRVVDQLALEQAGQGMPQIEIKALPEVNADPELLQRVLVNLIGNAVKFSRGGATPGRVEIGASSESGGVEVYIQDNGVGFDADAAQRLFAPFVRLHGAGFDGHGVGLSIVRRAVERHGGRVWADGRPGHGAVFRFSLPA